jgi:hypothetical protein
MSSWVRIRSFPSRAEAQIAGQFLETQGITSQIDADDLGGLQPQLATLLGTHLAVLEEDAPAALHILSIIDRDHSDPDGNFE